MAEKRAVCLTAVDGTGPHMGNWYIAKGGINAPKRALGASDAGSGVGERSGNLAEVGMRTATLTECDAAVRGGPIVVDHHVFIGDAFVPGPADLRQPLRYRRRGNHIAGHGQDRPPDLRKRAKPGVRGKDDLLRHDGTERGPQHWRTAAENLDHWTLFPDSNSMVNRDPTQAAR